MQFSLAAESGVDHKPRCKRPQLPLQQLSAPVDNVAVDGRNDRLPLVLDGTALSTTSGESIDLYTPSGVPWHAAAQSTCPPSAALHSPRRPPRRQNHLLIFAPQAKKKLYLCRKFFHMQTISKRVQSLAVSQTRYVAEKAPSCKAQGVDVINLSVGEPEGFSHPRAYQGSCRKGRGRQLLLLLPRARLHVAAQGRSPTQLRARTASHSSPRRCGGQRRKARPLQRDYGHRRPRRRSHNTHSRMGRELHRDGGFAEGKPVTVAAGIDRDKVDPAALEAAITPATRAIIPARRRTPPAACIPARIAGPRCPRRHERIRHCRRNLQPSSTPAAALRVAGNSPKSPTAPW